MAPSTSREIVFNRKTSISLSNKDGIYAWKTSVPMDMTSLDREQQNGTYQVGTLSGEILPKWVNGFRLKQYHGPMPENPFKVEADAK